MALPWSQALAWRLERHLLEPVGTAPVVDVVRRLGAVPAMDESLAELTVRVRRAASQPGELRRALVDGDVVKVFAFRGATHYLAPDDAGAYLALRAAGRQWELPSWQEFYGLTAADWPAFRAAVRDALGGGPLTVAELGAAVCRSAAFRHLQPVFDEGAGTLVKPLTWQGDMAFGPPRDGRPTFRLLDPARWAGVWELEQAGRYAVRAFLRSFGPATHEQVHRWLGDGLSAGRRRLQRWLADLADELAPVDVEGETAYVLREDLAALLAARPTGAVRFLPGHDPWVMGPGTSDAHVVPPALRQAVTRKANLAVRGGVVRGTWSVEGGTLHVAWSADAEPPPAQDLAEQVDRLAALLDRPLAPELRFV